MKDDYLKIFHQTLSQFELVLKEPESAIVRDAAIQRFEFCFELGWKTIQRSLREQGQDCTSPKGCLKSAFTQGWIDDEEKWVEILADRNLTSHTYDENLAKAVYGRLKTYLPLFQYLFAKLQQAAKS